MSSGPVRHPRCGPRRRRRRDQEGLPQAGASAPPGRQPRPGDAGEVQGRHPRLRGALRPGEASDVRPGRRPVQRRRWVRWRRRGRGVLLHRHHGRLLRRWRRGRWRRRSRCRWSGSPTARTTGAGRPDPARGRPRRGRLRHHPRADGRHRRAVHGLPRRRRRPRLAADAVRDLRRTRRDGARCSARSSARSAPCVRARRAAASARSSPSRAGSARATAACGRAAR